MWISHVSGTGREPNVPFMIIRVERKLGVADQGIVRVEASLGIC